MKSARELVNTLAEYASRTGRRIIIVPGGGPFADIVREHAQSMSDDVAHWMAVLAMDLYGMYLADETSARVIENFEDVTGGASIILPHKLLQKEDPLPHSWDVTSDSIAAYIASVLQADFIKATDVDGIYLDGELVEEIDAEQLSEMDESCVDAYLARFLIKEKMNCTIVNGDHPDRVISAIENKSTTGTIVIGKS